MQCLSLLLLTDLVFFCMSVACLPFLCVRNRHLAITQERSLYDKSAEHLALFGALAFFMFGVALFLDYYFNGFIVQYFIRPRYLDNVFMLLANLFLLGGIVFFILLKLGKISKNILFKFNVLVGLILLFLISLLSWVFLRSTIFFQEWSFVQLWSHEPLQNLFLVYMLLCLFLGLMGAHILSIIFFIVRRNRDDYGRDYYNIIVASHAKRAMCSGLLLCIPVAILVFAMPVSYEKSISLISALSSLGLMETPVKIVMETQVNADNTLMPLPYNDIPFYVSLFILFIPLSVLCLQRIVKSPLPMQKKSFVFFALLFSLLGLTALMFRLWY